MKLIIATIVLGAGLALAGGQSGISYGMAPLFAWCVGIAFASQWLAFIPSYLKQTERFYDLIGSVTYFSVIGMALLLGHPSDPRSQLLAILIAIWAIRLGSFLFHRIYQDGSDSRFDKIKPNPLRFLGAWSLQGFWVAMTAACALAAMTSIKTAPLFLMDAIGMGLWLLGFTVEVIADQQKRNFRKEFGSSGFITSGLWSISRHPNYLGEIALWVGIALLAMPVLQGWQWLTVASPLFVYLLLTRVSGIPLLEQKSDKKWGDNEDYLSYKANTPVLFPRLRS
ncbi:MAG: steroid 5-alpha reductase family enzyme [Halieaceae bacterium]